MSRNYTTAAEDAASIRKAFKELGWNSRKVSVRCDNYSMGSSVYVTIKSPEIDEQRAELIAKGTAEHIDRDQFGDILSGGNRFVHISHSRECQEIMARRHFDALTAALDRLREHPEDRNRLERVTDRAYVGLDDPTMARLWVDDRSEMSFYPVGSGIDDGAFHLARLLDRTSALADAREGE